jgi:hypothetical protein
MATTLDSRKIYGASLIGVALVAGAFVLSDFGRPTMTPTRTPEAVLTTASSREYIPVTDTNSDGVEDWREPFVDASPIVVAAPAVATTSFVATTVTGQVGVQLMEALMINRTAGVGPLDQAALINKTTERLATVVQDKLYTSRDITIVPNSDEAIRTYGNAMGQSIASRNVPKSENEIDVLNRAVQTGNKNELEKIKPVANMYMLLRDDALELPVPETFVEEHLIMINVYNALYQNLDDMQLVFSDPTVTLLRINRYQDDVQGLVNGFKRFYNEALRNQALFVKSDIVWVFALFGE